MSFETYDNTEYYSPTTTLIPFNPPLPLLRHPVPSTSPTPYSPYTLAFPSPRSFQSAYTSSLSKLTSQCISGAKIGCSLSASLKCTPPWYKQLFLSNNYNNNNIDREKCEEREMEGCVVVAKEKCVVFAKEKSEKGFKDVRVTLNERCLLKCLSEVGTCKGSELMGLHDDCDFGKKMS